VSIADLPPYGVVEVTKETTSRQAFDEIFHGAFVPSGTLLMSFKLTIGRVATLGVPAVHNEAIISIYPKPGIDQRFLGYYLSQLDYGIFQDRQIKGNTLNKAKIDEIPVPMPPLDEQIAIANTLALIREAIAVHEDAWATTLELKNATMDIVFSRGVRGEPLAPTALGDIPTSWSVERLEACAEVISTRMQYGQLESLSPSNGADAVPVLGVKVSDMNRPGNEVELHDAALIASVPLMVAEHRCAPPGTIIFPKRGAAIATNKKRIATTWTAFDPNVIGVVASDRLDRRYLYHWFQSFDLRTITESGPTPQLNKKDLEPLLIPVPHCIEEQRGIAEILDELDEKVDIHRRAKATLVALFESLMGKLFRGELRVDDLELAALSGPGDPAGGAA
jgi:type I restriction enzyme S subunit